MVFDLINLDKVRRAILYAAWLLIALALQNLFLSHVPLFGVRMMFIPAVVIAIGFFEGGVWGGVLGLMAGFLCDQSYHTVALFTVLFPVMAFGAGLLAQFFLNKKFLPYLALAAAGLIITAFCQMFRLLVTDGTELWSLLRTGFIQVLWSLPMTAAVYFPPRYLAGRKLA